MWKLSVTLAIAVSIVTGAPSAGAEGTVLPLDPEALQVTAVPTGDGYAVAAWIGSAYWGQGVRFARYDLDGHLVEPPVDLGTLATDLFYGFRLVPLPGGYHLYLRDWFVYHRVQRLDATGRAVGATHVVEGNWDLGGLDAVARGAGSVAVFSSLRAGFRPYSRAVGADGSPDGHEWPLDVTKWPGGFPAGWIDRVRIVGSRAGLLALWPAYGGPLYARRLKPNGEPKGGLIEVEGFASFPGAAAPVVLGGREYVVYSMAPGGGAEDLYLRELHVDGTVSDAVVLSDRPEAEGVAFADLGPGLDAVAGKDRIAVLHNVVSSGGAVTWRLAEFDSEGVPIGPPTDLTEEYGVAPWLAPDLEFDRVNRQYLIAFGGTEDALGGFLLRLDPGPSADD